MAGLLSLAQGVESLCQLLTLRTVRLGVAKQAVKRTLFKRQRLPAQIQGMSATSKPKGATSSMLGPALSGWAGVMGKNLSSAIPLSPVTGEPDSSGSTPRLSGSLPNSMKSSEETCSRSGC
ncbi:hypothetical protein V5O39_31035 [Pseudomonas parakoreensis]